MDQTSFDMMQALYSPFFEIVNGEMYYGNGLCESVTANDDASEFTLKLKDGLNGMTVSRSQPMMWYSPCRCW